MEEEKDVFYVVRKGDIVGVYNTLTDSPSFHSSSICDPPISIYKGYCLSKETEKYLASHGLTNARCSISFTDLKVKDDLFGRLVPCPLQLPPSEGKATQQSFLLNDDIGATEIEDSHEVGSDRVKSLQIDAFRKHVKLEDSLKPQAVYCILNFAGSSIGNPGKAGAGAILRSEDGNLVQGTCKIKDDRMSFLCEEAMKLKDKFFSFQIKHVSKTAKFTKLVMRINLDVIKSRVWSFFTPPCSFVQHIVYNDG
ncbi:hypothetical protein Scep_021501 [Stephania cephalantha]|uniref:RNase H type-1 domain-containing protein n=1 Tax=Stephania cephalantha TaxID=152367 RepID=A0AAP0F935_9MAGN